MSGEEIVSEVYKEIFKEISLNIDKNSLPPVITNRFFAIDSLSDAESINNQQENSSKLVTLESYKIYGPHQTGTLNASDPNTKENQAIKLVPGPGIGNKEKNRTAIYAPNTIDFRKDFNMNFDIALWPQGMSSRPDGLGFMFSKSTPEEYLSQGGILNDSGVSNAFGFKIDTYNNGNVDNLEKDFSKEKGASPKAYGTFVYNDANGTTHSYTKYPLDNQNRQQKNNLFNGFTQAFNGFRGQQYNTVNINYNADSGKLTVNYAGLTWTALLSDIGADKNSRYNFGIISSKETDRNVPGSYHTVKVNSASITYTPGSNDAQDKTAIQILMRIATQTLMRTAIQIQTATQTLMRIATQTLMRTAIQIQTVTQTLMRTATQIQTATQTQIAILTLMRIATQIQTATQTLMRTAIQIQIAILTLMRTATQIQTATQTQENIHLLNR
ncbi:hypothetical protein [Staphylococcus aureus]|uniref:lectin-like domain-containing protein n=1 Tax=Staphylococcus aureus TaxID=1280 RepID=UPI0036039CC7